MHCRICGSEKVNRILKVREMMIPTFDQFDYFECGECHCLQIEEVPAHLYDYYGSGYYSYQEEEVEGNGREIPEQERDHSRILDVGCGAGKFLKSLRAIGFDNLFGCDPFLERDLFYGEEIRIYKRTIHEMDGQFDKIFLNDSFEHVTDPHEVMESIRRLLSPGGVVRIAIPIYPNIAFDMFEANWYQLDAPRHIFLHSRQSMELLSKAHGLQILEVTYDADSTAIFRSYLYSKGVPFWEQRMRMILEDLGEEEAARIHTVMKEANGSGYGDHAVFVLGRIEDVNSVG